MTIPPTPIDLGPFELHTPLGRGAMGEVWQGVHRAHGVPVAVKLLTSLRSRQPSYHRAFREEVRAVAALSHPGIVTVYEYGQVPEKTATQVGGRWPAGSPYLVMELIEGGSLSPLRGQLEWPALYRVLLGLLDALGHAHARGVIHRDLKPANVLVTPAAVSEPADGGHVAPSYDVKLTDFGLSHALHRYEEDPFHGNLAGTPSYMAPEQVRCRWRDFGPSTDFYALGCLTYALLQGESPFRRERFDDTLQAQMELEPEPPETSIDLPPGLDTWLRRLLEKDAKRRYQRAADATWALQRLAGGHAPMTADEAATTSVELPVLSFAKPASAEAKATPQPDSEATVAQPAKWQRRTWSQQDWEAVRAARQEKAHDALVSTGPEPFHEAPAIAVDWRCGEPLPWNPLVGAGLGLYGLRTIPMIDRVRERNHLWHTLRAIHTDREPRAVVLRGAAGLGKSSLARWLSERADELGAATTLIATHSPTPTPRDGLAAMLARHHRCEGLDRAETAHRLESILHALGESHEEAWDALATVIAASGAAGSGSSEAGDGGRMSQRQRFGVLVAHLRRLGRQRPIVLWLDDAQWSTDAPRFASHILDRAPGLPVMVLVTIDDNPEPGESDLAEPLLRVLEHRATTLLEVDPIPDADMPALIGALLGLDCEVAAKVQARSQGNPLFAIHLVGDWVQSGALVPAETGFRLRPDTQTLVPDAIHDIWTTRIEALLQGGPPADRIALELAALLGPHVDETEWQTAVASDAPDMATDLLDRLFERRLANRVPGSASSAWTFTHALLRESVVRGAAEAGRLFHHHRTCARVLASLERPGTKERRARHLLGAGEDEAALGPLIDAAQERVATSDFDGATALLREWKGLADRLGLPPSDPRRGLGWSLSCRLARTSGQLDRARRLARAAEEEARHHGWESVLARTLVDRAWDAVNEGAWSRGISRLREAGILAARLDDQRLLANCFRNQAVILLDRGESEVVAALLRQAIVIYEALGHRPGQGLASLNLAQLKRRGDRFTEAVGHLDRAARAFATAGARWGLAMVLTERGQLAYDRERLDDAELLLQSAIERYQAVGGINAPLPEMWLAQVRVAQARYDEARSTLTALQARFAQQSRHGRELQALLGLLAADAGQQRWSDWAEHLHAAQDRLAHLKLYTRDQARMAEKAARLAVVNGAAERAAEVSQIARTLRR